MLFTSMVTIIVTIALFASVGIYITLYQNSIEQNAITTSEQAVVQVLNTVENYTQDIDELMDVLEESMSGDDKDAELFQNIQKVRTDVVAITTYDENGNLSGCWSDNLVRKVEIITNLSYMEDIEDDVLNISKPHVESLFENEYPWVVTIARNITTNEENHMVAVDIRFSSIANYVDDVGIGGHGYCFILDTDGNMIYHPQQQLIYSGLKEENIQEIATLKDGSYTQSNVIYTLKTLDNCNWRIVGVSYVDEMITNKVTQMIHISIVLLVLVLLTAIGMGLLFSAAFSKPARKLKFAMAAFEENARDFTYEEVEGTKEIAQISDSFGHMVVQVQELMERVRQEEISLRKTELNALQTQINPHFLYNTLDSIAWMCEEERSKEAEEMVNTLARLFRISISKGHELIPIAKEVEHAKSYLKIQNYRYKNQFTYEFQVNENCCQYYCNKITLQPIIENAIYHGINRMVEEGNIHISIEETQATILMSVTDNGVGMSKEQSRDILLHESTEDTGIGIKNVHDRIRIYFGEEYGLTIESELDQGTTVRIVMPKIDGDTYEKME